MPLTTLESLQLNLLDRKEGLGDDAGPPVVIGLQYMGRNLGLLSLEEGEIFARSILALVARGRIPKDERQDAPLDLPEGTEYELGPRPDPKPKTGN